MKVVEYYTTKNPAFAENVVQADYQNLPYGRRDSRYINFQQQGAKGLVLHSIGCAQPKAKPIADNFNKASAQASVHAVLQADGTVLQCCPWNYRMWHVGGAANNTHIGVEMTEPACIWYDANNGYKVHITDVAKATEHCKATYQVAVELFAFLCQKLNLDPLKDGVIISHSEAYKRGWGSNHGDPEHLWNALNLGYTMDTFRRDVAEKMEENEMYHKLKDVPAWARAEINELVADGALRGKEGKGEEMVIDLSDGDLRLLVILVREVNAKIKNASKVTAKDVVKAIAEKFGFGN